MSPAGAGRTEVMGKVPLSSPGQPFWCKNLTFVFYLHPAPTGFSSIAPLSRPLEEFSDLAVYISDKSRNWNTRINCGFSQKYLGEKALAKNMLMLTAWSSSPCMLIKFQFQSVEVFRKRKALVIILSQRHPRENYYQAYALENVAFQALIVTQRSLGIGSDTWLHPIWSVWSSLGTRSASAKELELRRLPLFGDYTLRTFLLMTTFNCWHYGLALLMKCNCNSFIWSTGVWPVLLFLMSKDTGK